MKLALARAMLMRADILLLDEPTNHLDVANVAWLENYLVNRPEISSVGAAAVGAIEGQSFLWVLGGGVIGRCLGLWVMAVPVVGRLGACGRCLLTSCPALLCFSACLSACPACRR
jgi:hypothetical protein